jgi:hypothetical protein
MAEERGTWGKESEFEFFVRENFKNIPALTTSRTKDHLSTAFDTMMRNMEGCRIDRAITDLAHFCSLVNTLEGETVGYYRYGLVTSTEMADIITKFENFVTNIMPQYLAETLSIKCKCEVR